MRIVLYQNSSEMNRVDKSLTEWQILDGTLRDSCSILEPSVTVYLDRVPSFVNYMYIEEFGRYYFITGVTSVVNGLWAISGHVDVLSTYKAQIRTLSAIINRQENQYNLYLDDDKFLVNAQRKMWTKVFPNQLEPATGQPSFVLTIAGGPATEYYDPPVEPPIS